mmetsp:Transcript_54507/g.145439  ORF Transcript_54507/g.145439 Transcript_54507/m.145439 type:complete len:220 (+) Transcript_54507:1866-2525(+)
MVSVSSQTQVPFRLVVVLPEALDPKEVTFADCRSHRCVAIRRNLHKEVHLRGADCLAILLVQIETDEFDRLRHPCTVNTRDFLRDLNVVERRGRTCLWYAIPVHVTIAHRHQCSRMSCCGSGVQVEHRQCLLTAGILAGLDVGSVQHRKIVLRVHVAVVGGFLKKFRGIAKVLRHACTNKVHLSEHSLTSRSLCTLPLHTTQKLTEDRLIVVWVQGPGK